jgi:hypothetical protein
MMVSARGAAESWFGEQAGGRRGASQDRCRAGANLYYLSALLGKRIAGEAKRNLLETFGHAAKVMMAWDASAPPKMGA